MHSTLAAAHALIHLPPVMQHSEGSRHITIGIIDGPVDTGHPDLHTTLFKYVEGGGQVSCRSTSSLACRHGTFVAGILGAGRDASAPGICPACGFVARPIFCEAADFGQCPVVTTAHLAEAIYAVMRSGARVINLSLGLAPAGIRKGQDAVLTEAFDEAFRKGVIIVGASGNHGRIGHNPLFDHPWVIPVVACDEQGRPSASSNIGLSIGQRGIMAPGWPVTHLGAGGGYTQLSGTSIAAPFVTGSIALLWSLCPQAAAQQVHAAITQARSRKRGIVPPLLHVAGSKKTLENMIRS